MILYGLIILVLVSLGLRNPVARPFDKDIVTILKPLHWESFCTTYIHKVFSCMSLNVGVQL